ncbi:hypothetical protein KKF55_00965 [Patescibacteria group bacterium]|nr:hypothetical protein [Patescibacteria group bacterium]
MIKAPSEDITEGPYSVLIREYRETDNGGFVAHCVDLDIAAQGSSIDDTLKTLADLISLDLKVLLSDKYCPPRPAPERYWKALDESSAIDPPLNKNHPLMRVKNPSGVPVLFTINIVSAETHESLERAL